MCEIEKFTCLEESLKKKFNMRCGSEKNSFTIHQSKQERKIKFHKKESLMQ